MPEANLLTCKGLSKRDKRPLPFRFHGVRFGPPCLKYRQPAGPDRDWKDRRTGLLFNELLKFSRIGALKKVSPGGLVRPAGKQKN